MLPVWKRKCVLRSLMRVAYFFLDYDNLQVLQHFFSMMMLLQPYFTWPIFLWHDITGHQQQRSKKKEKKNHLEAANEVAPRKRLTSLLKLKLVLDRMDGLCAGREFHNLAVDGRNDHFEDVQCQTWVNHILWRLN